MQGRLALHKRSDPTPLQKVGQIYFAGQKDILLMRSRRAKGHIGQKEQKAAKLLDKVWQ